MVSAPVEAQFSVTRVLRVLPKEIVSGVVKLLSATVGKATASAQKAYERALAYGLKTKVLQTNSDIKI